jgi:hypothetical protein
MVAVEAFYAHFSIQTKHPVQFSVRPKFRMLELKICVI